MKMRYLLTLGCMAFIANTGNSEQKKKLDVVLVVDNSASMRQEHRKLADNFSSLISGLDDVDWRLSVLTTEYNCSRGALISFDDQSRERTFTDNVTFNQFGSGYEIGIQMVAENLQLIKSSECPEGEWRREDAKLAIIFVSDEDESSSGMPFYRFLTKAEDKGYELGYSLRVYAVTGLPGSQCESSLIEGDNFIQLARYSKGQVYDICKKEWKENLEKLSLNLRLFAG